MAGQTCADCTTTYTVGAEKCPQCGSTERAEKPGGAVLPSVTVACGNTACTYEGRERRVHLRTAAPGVLERPRLVCTGCGLDMPTVTPWPPAPEPEEETMPKISTQGGPSIADTEVAVVSEHRVELDPATAGPAPEEQASEETAESSTEEQASEPTTDDQTPAPAEQRRTRGRRQSTAE
ncbi:hypothetical protein AB0I66_21645 [Streptomyces sp. NPDC050439]|uniref:hypothetical protein n=1 Tax=unclassified Streptomyces TaxID=2593676 RepID=UPI00341E37F7